jgi:hypothetical protein
MKYTKIGTHSDFNVGYEKQKIVEAESDRVEYGTPYSN